VTRFCPNPDCGRGFITNKPAETLCPTCRQKIPVLSRLFGGQPRKAELKGKGEKKP
jgi:hypothetical protein